MTTDDETDVEPTAAAPPALRRRFLTLVALFLAGPSIWITHFMAVYLLAEAVCTAEVEARLLGLPVLSTVTLLATAVAVVATGWAAAAAYRRRNRDRATGEPDAGLAFAGFLLSVLFALAVLFVGLPALVLDPC